MSNYNILHYTLFVLKFVLIFLLYILKLTFVIFACHIKSRIELNLGKSRHA